MFRFSNSLPFTTFHFFLYMVGCVLLFHGLKFVFKSKIKFQYLIAGSSVIYLLLLFPKPGKLAVLLLYYYGIYYIFSKRLNYKKLLLPVCLFALPMIFMKYLNVVPSLSYLGVHREYLNTWIQIAGMSYITFKVIQMYIDENQSEKPISLLAFFNYTTFVPTLLIGPIDRFQRFTDNVQNGFQSLTYEMFSKGFNIFVKGILYKFIIGHAISSLIISHLADDGSLSYHLAYMYSYLFYLFFDFAGYCLLAIGFGNMLGINVPFNFDKPFLAVNPKEFWQKWHKTLGDWLNDYFFKPIFKELTSKKVFKSIQRQNIALMATFTLMGFWNGFKLHFVVSGMLFGLYSVIHNYYFYLCQKNKRDVFFGTMNSKFVRVLSIFILFNSVAFAIYIFSGKLI